MSSRPFTRVQGVGYTAPEGGRVHVSGEATAIGPLHAAPEGWALGPLQVNALADTRVVIESLTYERESGGSFLDRVLSNIPLAGLALPALGDRSNPPPEQDEVSRRDFVKAGVAALGGAALTMDAAAASDLPTLSIATLNIQENNHGMGLSLWDGVSGVLPSNQDYHVLVDGVPVDDFSLESPAEIPAGMTGTTRVVTTPNVGFLNSLQWSIRGERELSYEFTLEQLASEYEPGREIVLTNQSLVSSPLVEAGGDASTMELGSVMIPHRSEASSSAGEYYVRESDAALVYQAGQDAPGDSTISLRIHTGRLTEIKEGF